MIFYTILFLVSLAGAVVALIFLRMFFGTSRSVYTSKERIDIVHVSTTGSGTPGQKDGKATRSEVAGLQPAPEPASTPGQINLDWQGGMNQAREEDLCNAVPANASRCSLYDVSKADSASGNDRNVDWSLSEEKREPGENTRKAPRKAATEPSDLETLGKPWGW